MKIILKITAKTDLTVCYSSNYPHQHYFLNGFYPDRCWHDQWLVWGSLIVMIVAVVFSVIIMMMFAVPVGRFVNRNPTIQMLGLSFLILIGFMLIIEGGHLAHLKILDSEIGAVPKGYLYFAIAFSLMVEFLNMRLRKKEAPVKLHTFG